MPGVAIEHDRQLLPGDGIVRAEQAAAVAAGDPLRGGPADSLTIGGRRIHVGEGHQVVYHRAALQRPQGRDRLAPGQRPIGLKAVRADAGHQAVLTDIAHRLDVPGIHIGEGQDGQGRAAHLIDGHGAGHLAGGQ